MIRLILYGVVILVIAGMLYAAYEYVVDKGRNEVRAEYAPLITKCDKRKAAECALEWSTAITYNESLQRDVEKLGKAAALCSGETKKGEDLTAKAEAEKQRGLGRTEGYRAGLSQSSAEFERRMAAVSAGNKTCEQTMATVGGSLIDLAKQRIRYALGFDSEPPPAATDSMKVK